MAALQSFITLFYAHKSKECKIQENSHKSSEKSNNAKLKRKMPRTIKMIAGRKLDKNCYFGRDKMWLEYVLTVVVLPFGASLALVHTGVNKMETGACKGRPSEAGDTRARLPRTSASSASWPRSPWPAQSRQTCWPCTRRSRSGSTRSSRPSLQGRTRTLDGGALIEALR